MSDPAIRARPLAPDNDPAAIEHLKMIQAVITRLAGNSAQCKTWCIAITTAIVAFAGAVQDENIVAVAIVPLAIFGFLDAAYLGHERAYRRLYNDIAAKIRDGRYAPSDRFVLGAPAGAGDYVKAFGSWSVWPVYLGLIAAYVIIRLIGLYTYTA
ncbi:MAG: hypothetical protein AB7H90_03550 [Alphaproteobacteria bacterium]